jgi:hypothetical protein
MSDTEHPAADRMKLEKRRIALALCDILRDYIPKACKRDAEMHLIEFFSERKIRVVLDE